MPDIFTYLDYRSFLEDWFAARKETNRRFSHRLFARLAGHKNPSLLLQVIHNKRNLTEASLQGFLKAMKLDADEAAFFSLLVQLDQGRTHDERKQAWEAIAATRRFRRARRLDTLAVRFLQDWSYPAIHELAQLPGFRNDPEQVSRSLHPTISLREARKALKELHELGLLDQGKPTDKTVVTPHQLTGVAVRDYHRQMMERAEACLDSVPADQRHFGAVTVAINSELLPALKAEVASFQERILELCDSADAPADRVYQLNLQLFPLSRPLENG